MTRVEAEVNTYSLQTGDLYLLCSDGLTLEVDEQNHCQHDGNCRR